MSDTTAAPGKATGESFRVAAIQMRGTPRVEENVAAASSLVRAAAAEGATYVQTPEITNVVQRGRSRLMPLLHPEDADPALAAFRALASELGILLHLGSLALLEGDRAVNRGFLIGPDGAVRARYDKIHMFDVDLPNGESWRESDLFAPGREAVLAAAGPFGLGMTICYDVRFPALYETLARAGADLLAVPACFTRQTGEAHWHALVRARAIENGAFLVAATQGGRHEDGRESYGHAIVVDPWGRVLAEGGEDPSFVIADLDPAAVADARRRIPALGNRRTFALRQEGALPARALAGAAE